jgi:hypothetical protein
MQTRSCKARLFMVPALALTAFGCASEDTRRLDPTSVALSDAVGPVYDDGELTIYEAKTGLMLPIVAPDADELSALGSEVSDPFARAPWVTSGDVEVQVNWTLSNLDAGAHSVWVMVDPWNEFGRYQPAIHVSDEEAVRDLSGIDMLFELPGLGEAASDEAVSGSSPRRSPRLHGTFTFDDMDELAGDFATVFKILSAVVVNEEQEEEEDPRATLVNHAFNVRDRSYNSPLLAPYRPSVVPGLVGFDFGVRTFEPANVALEIVVEVRDLDGDRVAERGERVPLLEPPGEVITVP